MDGGLFPPISAIHVGADLRWLTKPQRAHLRWFLFALLASSRKAKLSHVARTAPRGGYRTSCGCFSAPIGDAPQLLSDQAMRTLRWMKPKAKEVIYLTIASPSTKPSQSNRCGGNFRVWSNVADSLRIASLLRIDAMLATEPVFFGYASGLSRHRGLLSSRTF